MVGFLNDVLDISIEGKGLPLLERLIVVFVLSGFIGWWFYAKLAVTAINIPFGAPLALMAMVFGILTLLVFFYHMRLNEPSTS